jgi:ABC-type polysaccharide/polyol phosphate export permease
MTKEMTHWWDFVWAFTLKEVKVRYKKAFLGFLWMIINPLLQMAIIGLIFQFFVPVKVENYFLFLFAGLLPWNFFSYSVTKNTPMVLNERGLIKKAKFPREAIILSVVLSNLFHFLIAWTILVSLLIGDKIISEHYTVIQLITYLFRLCWTLPLIGWLVLITTGFSLLFATLNVRFRDVNFVVQAIMPVWFYATPIVYTLNILPESLSQYMYLNPLTGLIELFHFTLLNQPIQNVHYVAANFLLSLVIFLFGWMLFSKEAPFFDDWV